MWTVQDTKNKFSAVAEAALAGRPQEVSPRDLRAFPGPTVLLFSDRLLPFEAEGARI